MPVASSIVAFAGHTTDGPELKPPRFPEWRVPAVRAELREKLAPLPAPLVGVSSAARGGDLLFLDVLSELGGSAQVVLPFPAEDFKRTSVGHGWDERFDRLLRAEGVDVRPPLYPVLPATSKAKQQAYAEVNQQIVSVALALAEQRQVEPLLLVVYQPSARDARGGTKQMLEQWQRLGRRFEIIHPME